jgi:hypothetical protein
LWEDLWLFERDTTQAGDNSPLAEKYVYQNPYNYVSNNPVKMIDPDGKDNVIYLVMLPGNDKEVTRNLVKNLTNLVSSAKMNVKIHMVTDSKKFDISKIDKTDAVAVIGGNKKSVSDYITKNFDGYVSEGFKKGEAGDGRSLTSWLDSDFNPEITDGGGENGWSYVTAISTEEFQYDREGNNKQSIPEKLGTSDRSLATAFNILHGAGHLSGIYHGGNGKSPDMGFMYDGNILNKVLTGSGAYSLGKIDSLVKKTAKEEVSTMDKINGRFSKNITPKLNYEPK